MKEERWRCFEDRSSGVDDHDVFGENYFQIIG